MEKINFKPAEVHLLKYNGDSRRKELFPIILIQLVLGGVLKIEKEQQNNPQEELFEYHFITKGHRFDSYNFDDYEKIFIAPLIANEYRLQMDQYLRSIDTSVKTTIRSIAKLERLKKYVRSNLFYRFKRKKAGKVLTQTILRTFHQADQLFENENATAADMVKLSECLGANIFFLKSFDKELFAKLLTAYKKTEKDPSTRKENELITFNYSQDWVNYAVLYLDQIEFMYDHFQEGIESSGIDAFGCSSEGCSSDGCNSGCSIGGSCGSGCSSCGSACGSGCGGGCSS